MARPKRGRPTAAARALRLAAEATAKELSWTAPNKIVDVETRDPEIDFDYDDLANALRVATIEAHARIKVLDARMQKCGAERENLYRFTAGSDRALGLDQPPSSATLNPSKY